MMLHGSQENLVPGRPIDSILVLPAFFFFCLPYGAMMSFKERKKISLVLNSAAEQKYCKSTQIGLLSKNVCHGNYSEYRCSFMTTPLNYFHVERSSSDRSSFLEGGNFPHI